MMSEDPLWFLGGVTMTDPERIVIRVDGQETVLTAGSPGYDLLVDASKEALSKFNNLAPRSMGLREVTLTEYQLRGIILELYFSEPVDFHLPFNDLQPTALLIPIEGRHAGHGYVFRGKNNKWLAGQMCMSDPQPLFDALSTLGYIQQ
ncbi:MAG: hypothetical protein KAS19_07175 [Anaerolineales bacterium]|nr:hypothetical protein [Anaerolineales bacterium]